jgi:crotonobetainyl-CoA:carnitine CoA-transferase CaiB-like acyl-CoA transferase
VYDLPQALDNPFLREIGMLCDLPHPAKPDYRVLANPIKFDGERVPSRIAPRLGEQTDAVLREVGFTDSEIADLKAKGVA